MVAGQFFTNDLTVICTVCCELQYTKDRGIDTVFIYKGHCLHLCTARTM